MDNKLIEVDINKALYNAETRVLVTLLADYENYEIFSRKTGDTPFFTPMCVEVYEILKKMYVSYSKIDRSSLEVYLEKSNSPNKESILNLYDLIMSNFKNLDLPFDKVFEEYSIVSSSYKFRKWVNKSGGIDEVFKKLTSLDTMEEVNRVIEGRLLDFFGTASVDAGFIDTSITDLITDDYIEGLKNKEKILESTPFLPQFPILNRILKGMVRGSTGFAMHSGQGKTSAMCSIFIMSILENSKDKINIYANEQTANTFLNMLFFAFLSQVYNTKNDELGGLGYINLSRDKFINSSFSDEEIKKFIFIVKLFKNRYKNRITHTFFEELTPNLLAKDIQKKYRTGHRYFFFDTMKDPDEDYKKLMKLVTVFDNQTKKLPVFAYSSLQLSDESEGVKYLTNRHLASAKGTKRVFENLILARQLDRAELKYLKVHKLGHKEEPIAIDYESDNYYAFFIDKNRNGANRIVLLYQVYLDILKYKEIGVIDNMPKDDFRVVRK